jgi:hypothetical protein
MCAVSERKPATRDYTQPSVRVGTINSTQAAVQPAGAMWALIIIPTLRRGNAASDAPGHKPQH